MNMKKKILIVEDEVILSTWFKTQLEEEGFLVCGCVTTGEEAIEFVQNTKPDLVLLDINLVGEIDGIETAKLISKKSKTPIVFMTGYEEPEVFSRAQKTKPIAFLTKPIEIWDIKPIIESIFNKI